MHLYRFRRSLKFHLPLGALVATAFVASLVMVTQERLESAQDPRRDLVATTDTDKVLAEYFGRYRAKNSPLQPGDIVGLGPVEYPTPPPPGTVGTDLDDLRNAVCAATAVVLAKPTVSRVRFNTNETFLFTVYDLSVEQWFHPQRTGTEPDRIEVAVAGGEATLDNRRIKAVPRVNVHPDSAALFFLQRLDKSSVYVLARQLGVVSFNAGYPTAGIPTRSRLFSKQETKANFLTAVGNVAVICRSGK